MTNGLPSANESANDVATNMRSGTDLHQRGKLDEAEAHYRAVLAESPAHFDALHLLGVIHYQRGAYPLAVELMERAIAVQPGAAAAHSNLGNALRRLKRPAEALACYERALELAGNYAEAWNNRGNALLDLGRFDEALLSYGRALELKPGYAEAHNNCGNALSNLNRSGEALESFDRAVALKPSYAEAWYNRGNTLFGLQRTDAAIESYDRALEHKPDYPEALNNRGFALRELGRADEALASIDRALQLRPGFKEALANRGTTLMLLKRFTESAATFARLIELEPAYDYALGYCFHARLQACDWTDYESAANKIAAAVERGERADMPFSFLTHSLEPAAQLKCTRTHIADKYPPAPQPLWRGERYEHNKIRLAYLSSAFHDHPIAALIAELFEIHDRTRFEIYAISFGPERNVEMRERLRWSFDRFIDVCKWNDRDVAGLLRRLEIDIAVDLNGLTEGNRTGILAHRAAPVQVNYLGFPGTLGADYVDYIIADPTTVPHDHDRFHSEQVVRLPECYQVNDRKRRIADHAPSRAELGLGEKSFVFSCFNNSYKITPLMFGIWMRLLQRVERSQLWLLEDNAEARRNLQREAERRGAAAERIIFAPRVRSDEHLARHARADVFLDTLPYNAHTTASDALWAGLPLITCMGETFASRVAGSLLRSAGLPELIAPDLNAYETLAFKLATQPDVLREIRSKLAANRTSCALFDTDRFRRHIEAAFVTMYERHQSGMVPVAFDVPPIER